MNTTVEDETYLSILNLSHEIFGEETIDMDEDEIVDHATSKIRILKDMLKSTGMHSNMIDAIMRSKS